MTKRLALAFGTRDRVELSERSVKPLFHNDIDLWIVDGSKTSTGERFAAGLKHSENHVRVNVHGGADAWIVYALSTLLNETDTPYVGLCENDVLLHRDWLAPTLALFERGRADGLEVGSVSARCYADRILCQRDGYALMHNLGAGHIVLTRHAARLILDNFRTSWATENRKVFHQTAGIDIAKYWAFRGNQQFITADWGFDRVLAAHGLASLALTPSPVEMIGQDPPLADQGLVLATEPVELLRNDDAFARFVETTRRIRDGDLAINGQRFCRFDDGSQVVFPHQIGAVGGACLGNWRLRWAQGFGPFSYAAAEPDHFDLPTEEGRTVRVHEPTVVTVPLIGPCSFFVGGGEKGGKVEIVDTHSGYTCSPELIPDSAHNQMMQLVVPGGVAYRNVRLTALTLGVVFYGIKVHEPQPFVPHWSFEHSQLPPVG